MAFNTAFALMARYESTTVSLEDVCEEFLGITPKTANARANAGRLEFPVFRLRDSSKAPYLVNIADLANYIDKRYSEALAEWKSLH